MTTETKQKLQTIQPKWIKPSMTLEHAAREASVRNCYLTAHWDSTLGIRVVAVRRQKS